MFHNITLPIWLFRLLPMQAVPFSNLHEDMQLRIKQRISLPSDTKSLLLRPCQATMPMGFKWAVFIAHTFVDSCFDESFRLLTSTRLAFPSMSLGKLRGEDAPYILEKRSPLLLHIIEDAAVLTIDWPANLVTTWHRLIRRILSINRLPVAEAKSSNPAAVVRDSLSFIGCNWNLTTGLITPSADKFERVTARAKGLLEASTSTSEDWQRINGKLLWFATLNRLLLACTQAIFHRANSQHPSVPAPNSQSSKRELRTLTALLPFASVDINLPISHIVVAFDASTTAGAVTYAYAPPHLAERLWLASQRARFSRGRDASDQLSEVTQVVQHCKWKLAFTHYWKQEEHINCLEACTAVLTAEWMARSRMTHTRITVLTDSLVALGALQKGRSSKTVLLLRCRRFAAITLAHDMRITLAYVRSALNPADKFTRIPLYGPALTQNGDNYSCENLSRTGMERKPVTF